MNIKVDKYRIRKRMDYIRKLIIVKLNIIMINLLFID